MTHPKIKRITSPIRAKEIKKWFIVLSCLLSSSMLYAQACISFHGQTTRVADHKLSIFNDSTFQEAQVIYLHREAKREIANVFRVKNENTFEKGNCYDLSLQQRNRTEKIIAKAIYRGYFSFILAKLNEQHLPAQLALLPVIESSYESQAVSSKGAAGLWQLMPRTALYLGLKSTDRFQLSPSTMAALRYLQQLHKEFGNWELAIAAYNAGSGRVQKALLQAPNRAIQDLPLPRETKNYVAQFRALQYLLSNNFS